jgi:ribosomal protein L7/L12
MRCLNERMFDENSILLAIFASVIAVLGGSMLFLGDRGQARQREATRLAAIERKLDVVMRHLGAEEPAPEEPEVVQLLERGAKIQAVKIYRERTGTGLAEAKEAVERIARDRGLDRR